MRFMLYLKLYISFAATAVNSQGCGQQTVCMCSSGLGASILICAQAFSASLKRSLNLSANKHYHYYYFNTTNDCYHLATISR
jgi:hypothetical protein